MKAKTIEHSRTEIKVEFPEEGHGFCNLLRKTLLEEPDVQFAGYTIEHPLLANPVVSLKTKKRQANVVLREGFERILARTEEFRKKFNQAVSDYNVD